MAYPKGLGWKRFEDISAIFIVLGFIGGLLQGEIITAIGSALVWYLIFRAVRVHNRRNGIM